MLKSRLYTIPIVVLLLACTVQIFCPPVPSVTDMRTGLRPICTLRCLLAVPTLSVIVAAPPAAGVTQYTVFAAVLTELALVPFAVCRRISAKSGWVLLTVPAETVQLFVRLSGFCPGAVIVAVSSTTDPAVAVAGLRLMLLMASVPPPPPPWQDAMSTSASRPAALTNALSSFITSHLG